MQLDSAAIFMFSHSCCTFGLAAKMLLQNYRQTTNTKQSCACWVYSKQTPADGFPSCELEHSAAMGCVCRIYNPEFKKTFVCFYINRYFKS